MPQQNELIGTIAAGLSAAFIGGLIARRLRLPVIVGYLLAGVAVGPFTPGFVADQHLASQLAEIGVILLMFGVGIHFSVADLLAVRRLALPGAIAQVAIATGIGVAVARWWGWSLGAGLVFGLALAVASTVVLLRTLTQRGILDAPAGQVAVGWLVVQDLIMVVALVLFPALAGPLGGQATVDGSGADLAVTLALTLGKVALFVALMLIVGVRIIPWLLARVERTGSRELFILAVLAAALGIAYVAAAWFGVSFALGAFLAGVVINESEFSHRAAAEALPLQDAFAVLFFVSVGMLLDPSFLVADVGRVLAVLGIILVGNGLIGLVLVRLLGGDPRTGLTVGVGLAQIGEFSFILSNMGLSLGLLPVEGSNLILSGALLSITLNPLLFTAVTRLEERLRGPVPARFLLALLVVLPVWVIAPGDTGARAGDEMLRVGTETLHRCPDSRRLWCGFLEVPLDRDDPAAGTLSIGYAWRPARDESRGTLVAQEGGPGYPSIGSYTLWREMFGPLLHHHDLLMVDARGTGVSHPIDCQPLQNFDDAAQDDAAFFAAVAACGAQLDQTFGHGAGGYVHASDLFGTADAVEDMAAVIRALETGPVDLYGDSYGSFFAQAFAARHPDLLRSLALDGTWPLVDADPWYPETMTALRFAFDAVCARSVACFDAAPGPATARLAALAAELAETPIAGEVERPGRPPREVTVDAAYLAALAWSAGSSGDIYRELDAAGRAALAGDALPLLRLADRAGLNGVLSGGWPVESYSVGHAVTAPCIDYPQLYDMRAAPAERERQFAAAVASLPIDAFAPFARDDWLGSPLQDYNQCVPWPAPRHERELAPGGLPLVPPTLPVLVLAGDLDSVTALGGAETALAQLGPSARLVVFPSSTHIVAQGDIVGCGSAILRDFIRHPDRLPRLDTACAERFPEIRATGLFPRRLADQPLPIALAGNQATVAEQRLAALAVVTAGDALTYTAKRGRVLAGLRGGTIALGESNDPRVLTLSDVRYAEDVAVSGTVTEPREATEPIVVDVVAIADDDSRVEVQATWEPLQPAALTVVRGRAGDAAAMTRVLRVMMPAP